MQAIFTFMASFWWLVCAIAVVSFPVIHANTPDRMSLRRQIDLNALSQENLVSREYFYAGGGYIDDGSGTGQHVFTGQMYVEKLSPAIGIPKTYPLVFIHGQAQTSTVMLGAIRPKLLRLMIHRIGSTNQTDLRAGRHTLPPEVTLSISWTRRLEADRPGDQIMVL